MCGGVQSTPTPPLRGGPFHVQHSPGSPGEARGAGLHAAHSMPVMHMPSPRVGAHCAQQARPPPRLMRVPFATFCLAIRPVREKRPDTTLLFALHAEQAS